MMIVTIMTRATAKRSTRKRKENQRKNNQRLLKKTNLPARRSLRRGETCPVSRRLQEA
jgi:hypothetical protein